MSFTFDPEPALVPEHDLEEYGVEDPRITRIDGVYHITFVAVSRLGIVTCRASSTDLRTFERHGPMLHPDQKDVVLFPEKVGGRFAALTRPMPGSFGRVLGIWAAESDDLVHWGRHRPVLLPRPGMWDEMRVGASSIPIRTEAGWLVIYHGADRENRYGAGAILLDADDPGVVLSRTQRPILTPEAPYERDGFLHDVVFPSGHVGSGQWEDPPLLRCRGLGDRRRRRGDRRPARRAAGFPSVRGPPLTSHAAPCHTAQPVLTHLARLTRPLPAAGPSACAVAVYARRAEAVVADQSGFEGVACVDDAARLLDVLCDVWTATRLPWIRRWAEGVLDFVLWMQEPDGRWLNFVEDWDGTRNDAGITSVAGENFWHARALIGVSHAWLAFGDERAADAMHRGLEHVLTKPAPPDVRADPHPARGSSHRRRGDGRAASHGRRVGG